MQSLHDIQGFGWMDALDDGKYLDECFEVHATFRRILKDPPLLVLGRKGTGKTAICERILRISSPSLFTKKLNFAGYDWDRQDRETGGLDPQQCWKYAILLSLAGMVIRDASTASSGETHERLEEFLVETYGSLDIAFHQAFRPQRRLRLKALEFSAEAIRGLKTGAKFESEELPSSRLPSVIDDLNTTLETVILNTMNPEHFYYVLFDELDRDFHRGDQKYQRRLEGLFKAALDLLRASRDARLGVRIMVFLRSDIYEDEVTLSGEKNKITQNFTHTLDWSTPYLQRELKSLMEKRFRAALKDDRATWASVFGESSIGFPRRESFQFVLEHTMCRPRDFIQFGNFALKAFQERAADAAVFSEQDVLEACYRYGEYLYGELLDEAGERTPDLRTYFEMLKRVNTEKFYWEEFESVHESFRPQLQQPQPPKMVLQRLFDLSVVGQRRPSARWSPDQYIFRYLEVGAEFDRNASAYTVHEGLRAFLARYTPRSIT